MPNDFFQALANNIPSMRARICSFLSFVFTLQILERERKGITAKPREDYFYYFLSHFQSSISDLWA